MIIIHRINHIAELKKIPKRYGVEIDIRGYGEKILLDHNPITNPNEQDSLEDYLKEYKHRFAIFNIKEAGYEQRTIDLANKYGVKDYFLLDVEFPYLYNATRNNGFRNIAIRYSEAEPIEMVESQIKDGKGLLDWVWIDTNTRLPLNQNVIEKLRKFKTCLVCPERWGRPNDINNYIASLKKLNFKLDAVMTSLKYSAQWENSGVLK